jgi:hypothetical protein
MSCSGIQKWVFGTDYKDGNRAQNNGTAYQCRPWPNEGWCKVYEPGVTDHWQDAWTVVDECRSCGLIINETQTNRSSTPDDDFIEIVNTCATSIALQPYSLVYRSSAGTTDILLRGFGANEVIAPNTYMWFHGVQWGGDRTGASGVFSIGLSGYNGGLAIRRGTEIVDAVGWGPLATNILYEGTRETVPPRGSSMARIPNKQDTENNAVDFQAATPTPGQPNAL